MSVTLPVHITGPDVDNALMRRGLAPGLMVSPVEQRIQAAVTWAVKWQLVAGTRFDAFIPEEVWRRMLAFAQGGGFDVPLEVQVTIVEREDGDEGVRMRPAGELVAS